MSQNGASANSHPPDVELLVSEFRDLIERAGELLEAYRDRVSGPDFGTHDRGDDENFEFDDDIDNDFEEDSAHIEMRPAPVQ